LGEAMNGYLKLLALGAAALAPLTASGAEAQQARGRAVTHERVMQRGGALFDRLDANKDGVIDQAEYEKFIGEETAKLRERLLKRFTDDDAGKDGKLTREEFLAGREQWFQGIDANRDCVLDESEFAAARKANRGKAGAGAPQ
jgi:EF hand